MAIKEGDKFPMDSTFQIKGDAGPAVSFFHDCGFVVERKAVKGCTAGCMYAVALFERGHAGGAMGKNFFMDVFSYFDLACYFMSSSYPTRSAPSPPPPAGSFDPFDPS